MTHVRTLMSYSSKILTALVAAALVFSWTSAPAIGHHQPANKFAAAGAALEDIGPDEAHVILSETMKVPTTHDLAIHATLECSILTYLRTTGGPDQAEERSSTEGKVDMWVTIDGTPVPVQTTGYAGPEEHATIAGADDGSVTACNREYERYVADREQDEDNGGDGDGIDEERDFIRTKTATSFNWFALNIGSYDRPDYPAGSTTGNNVVVVELWAEYDRTEDANGVRTCDPTTEDEPAPGGGLIPQEDCSDAVVGKRVLIAEPTNASVHENVEPVDTPSEPGDQEPAPAPACPTYPICVGVAKD